MNSYKVFNAEEALTEARQQHKDAPGGEYTELYRARRLAWRVATVLNYDRKLATMLKVERICESIFLPTEPKAPGVLEKQLAKSKGNTEEQLELEGEQ